jgi:protein TonB
MNRRSNFQSILYGSIVASVLIHVAIFTLFPNFVIAQHAMTTETIEVMEIPPEVQIPPPPEQIQRPAAPVISDAIIDEDITIEPTTWDALDQTDLPPPRAVAETREAAQAFTPHTLSPRITNSSEVSRILEREYPPLLRDAGVTGTVILRVYLDIEGVPRDFEVYESSGNNALDRAALQVVPRMRFSPAQNRDQVVAVWIAIPVTFTVNR